MHALRACRVKCSPKGPKLGFEYLPTYKTLHRVCTACALRAGHCLNTSESLSLPCKCKALHTPLALPRLFLRPSLGASPGSMTTR